MANWITRIFQRQPKRTRVARSNPFVTDLSLPGNEMVLRELEGKKSAVTSMDMDNHSVGEPIFWKPTVSLDYLNKVNWIYDCIREHVEEAEAAELRVYRKNSDEPIKRNQLARLIERPNPWMSRREFIGRITFWREVTGNAYVYLLGGEGGKIPEALFLLNPTKMGVVPDSSGIPTHYAYLPGGEMHLIPAEQIVHIRGMQDEKNPFFGTSIYQKLGYTLQSELYRQQYDINFFRKGGRLSLGFKVNRVLQDKVWKRLKKEVEDIYGGVDNAHKVGVFEEAEPVVTGVSQKDMDFVALAEHNRDRILAAFGVPKSRLGLDKDVNRSTGDTQETGFYQKVQRRLDSIEDQLNLGLVDRFGNYELRFDEVSKKDLVRLTDVAKGMKDAGVYTVNEIRAITEHEPIDGGDKIPQPPNPFGPDDGGAESPEERNNGEDPEEKSVTMYETKAAGPPSRYLLARFEQAREQFIKRSTRKYAAKVRRFFNEQEKRVKQKILEGGKSHGGYHFKLSDLWDISVENQLLSAVLSALHLEVVKRAFRAASSIFFDQDDRFDINTQGGQAVLNRLQRNIKRINETTQREVREVVLQGMEMGLSVDQIAEGDPEVKVDGEPYKGVAGVYEGFRGYRAERIARSESADAYNLSTIQNFKANGVKRVRVMDGTEHDDECRRANGSIWSLNKAMNNLKAHPNCRRAFAPIIVNGKSLDDQRREGGIDWEEWKLEKINQLLA